MNKNLLKDENFWTVFLAGLGCIALIWNLVNNPSDWPNILINFTQIGVIVIMFIVTVSAQKSLLVVSKEELTKLSIRYNDFLISPRYNRENYDSENGAGLQYLFITNSDKKSKLKVKFIPIEPLSEGILEIYVQKATLVYGLGYKSEDATDEEIKRIQGIVFQSVNNFVMSKYDGFYELITSNKKDIAIIVDFDENKMGKKFVKAVAELSNVATKTLYEIKK